MISSSYLIPVIVFAAGFSTAWIVAPIAKSSSPSRAQSQSDIATKSAIRSRDETQASKARSLLESLLEKQLADVTDEWHPEKLPETEYPDLLAAILSRVGMSGLSNNEKNLLDLLLADWYQLNHDAALDWVAKSSEPDHLLSSIVKSVAFGNPDEAIALAERFGAAQGHHLAMPDALMEKLKKASADDLIHISSLFTQNGGSSSYINGFTFADGFDFQRAFDGLTQAQAALPNGEHLSFIPNTMLSEWANHDFDAAWRWLVSGEKSPLKDASTLLKQAAKTATPEELAGYVAQVVGLPNRSRQESLQDAWYFLCPRNNPELVTSFLAQMPGDRQQNLNSILATSLPTNSDSFEPMQQFLLSQMTPAERIAAFQSDAVRNLEHGIDRETVTAQLRQLGHSEDEITKMLPPLPNK